MFHSAVFWALYVWCDVITLLCRSAYEMFHATVPNLRCIHICGSTVGARILSVIFMVFLVMHSHFVPLCLVLFASLVMQWKVVKSFSSQLAHGAALISDSIALHQTPAEAAVPSTVCRTVCLLTPPAYAGSKLHCLVKPKFHFARHARHDTTRLFFLCAKVHALFSVSWRRDVTGQVEFGLNR